MSRRTWTAARTLNPLALSRTTSAANSKALRLEHGNLVPEEPTEWVPKGLFSTIDGANAARWAWILLGSEEDEVMAYVDWFVAGINPTMCRRFRRNGSGLHGTWRWRSGTTSPSEVLLSPAPTKRTEKEILRTDGPHGTDDDIEEAQTGQGGGGGSWGRKRRRGGRGRGRGRGGNEQDHDGGKKTEHGGYSDW